MTLNSRVTFRVGAEPAETRTLVQSEIRGPVGSSLPLATRRGLCILGMREGQTVVIEQPDGRRERILVGAVLYQPEGARRAAREKQLMAGRRPRMLTLVYSAAAGSTPLGEMAKIRQTGGDDPGPSAA